MRKTLCLKYLYGVCRGFSVLIHYFIGGWSGEFFADSTLAIERTQQLMRFRRVPLIDSYFIKSVALEKYYQTTGLI